MGKPGKKAGEGRLPPTNPKRKTDDAHSHLRDSRTIKRLKMYTSKVKRDKSGTIVQGSVLSADDRRDKSMARIAPDRRWFGNTRVIGQEALQQFRTEMKQRYNDPYSVVIKQGKLPLSLLEEGKTGDKVVNQMDWDKTFGQNSTRKRVRMSSASIEELAQQGMESRSAYKPDKDRAITKDHAASFEHGKTDGSYNRSLYKKGQSNRIWNELHKVIDSADVVLYVLDARDPMGTRSSYVEHYMKTEKKYKHFVFVLNKCDLIPTWATARWLQILSKDFPTVAFHASIEHPFGKGNLISLLRQFSRLHNVTHRGSKKTKSAISIGIVGYPNVGKSSVINTLRRKQVCKVAPIPGETKVWQYVSLTRTIFMIDCPGIVYDREGNNDVQAVLKGVVRVERLGGADKTDVVKTVLEICKEKDVQNTYGIMKWENEEDFLEQLARKRGKLLPGGLPDMDTVARSMLYDWQRGKVPWFNAPPFESNQEYRDAVEKKEELHLKQIEHYNTFNIVDHKIIMGEKPENDNTDSDEDEPDRNAGFLGEDEVDVTPDEEDDAAAQAAKKAKEEALSGAGERPTKKQRTESSGPKESLVHTHASHRPAGADQATKKKHMTRAPPKVEPVKPNLQLQAENDLWNQFLAS